jgi:hypothetical protein
VSFQGSIGRNIQQGSKTNKRIEHELLIWYTAKGETENGVLRLLQGGQVVKVIVSCIGFDGNGIQIAHHQKLVGIE